MKTAILCCLTVPALVAQAPTQSSASVVDYNMLKKEICAASETLDSAHQKLLAELQAIGQEVLTPIRAKQQDAKGETLEAALIAELLVSSRWMDLSTLKVRILKEVPATSPAWKLWLDMLPDTLPALPQILGAEFENYVKEIETKGAPNVRWALWWRKFKDSISDEDFAKANTILAKLKTDFPESPAVARLETELKEAEATGAAIAIGAQAPDFSIQNFDDEKVTFTPATFKGKYLMLDFWATWCEPCVGELSCVHAAYAKYKEKGLEILSLSADADADEIRAFRKQPETPMPWKHAFIGCTLPENVIYEAYRLKGFPTALLIGPDGKILEKTDALRGENLDKTLAKYLDKK